MARDKMLDPGFQKVFTEAILKENRIRLKWNQQYGHLNRPEGVAYDSDPDECEARCVCLPFRQVGPARDDPFLREELPEYHLPTNTIPRVLQPPRAMKPVPDYSRQLLYQGISHDGEGRDMYLCHRMKEPPFMRYSFPVTSNWEYGWHYSPHQ